MPGVFPNGVTAGTIIRCARFYVDSATGEFKPKFLVILALTRGGDVVLRLLTSRQHGRPELPPCYHGDPYPGFYLGVINAAVGLGSKSWLDLRGLEDADGIDMSKDLAAAVSSVVAALDNESLKAALQCTAAADDTTQTQEWAIRNQLAKLG